MSLRAAWPTMGSVASLTIAGPADGGPAQQGAPGPVEQVRAWFDEVEAALSPFRADSDLCRWRSGRAALEECSPLLAEIVSDVVQLQRFTEGGFHPYDRSGRYDPTGYVKGWAIQRGMDLLRARGLDAVCLGIGGDIQVCGRAQAGRPWRVAVADPADPGRVVALIEPPDATAQYAVATSGDAERGDHIWHALGSSSWPPRGPVPKLACLTVVGPELRLADAFATALWAQAKARPAAECWGWLAGSGYEAMAVERSGTVRATPGMGARLVRPAA